MTIFRFAEKNSKVACQATFWEETCFILYLFEVMNDKQIGGDYMSWWKNGLLLAAGGVAGLALAAWLESEGNSDRWDYDEEMERARVEESIRKRRIV